MMSASSGRVLITVRPRAQDPADEVVGGVAELGHLDLQLARRRAWPSSPSSGRAARGRPGYTETGEQVLLDVCLGLRERYEDWRKWDGP